MMPPTRHCTLIINPISGTSSKEQVAATVTDALQANGLAVTTRLTERAGHASELAAEAAARGDYAVLVAGGDGTVNETARALCGTATTLGILPMGSGNGLARHLSIPVSLLPALEVITTGRVVECDHCTVNGIPFFCTFGLGFDAAVSDDFASRHGRGLINYVKSAMEQFVKYKSEHYVIRCDGREVVEHAFLIACCNAAQYGNNAFIAPRASITDGLMDVTVLHAGTWLGSFLSGIEMIAGTLDDSARAHTFRCRSLTIERLTPGCAHIDGEPVTLDRVITVECHPHSLRVFSPGEMKVRPILTPVDAAVKEMALTIGDILHRR